MPIQPSIIQETTTANDPNDFLLDTSMPDVFEDFNHDRYDELRDIDSSDLSADERDELDILATEYQLLFDQANQSSRRAYRCFRCADCIKRFSDFGKFHYVAGIGFVCDSCYIVTFSTCQVCRKEGENFRNVLVRDSSTKKPIATFCLECYQTEIDQNQGKYFSCMRCSLITLATDNAAVKGRGGYCKSCVEHVISCGEVLFRRYQDRIQGKEERGNLIQNCRGFGIELEAIRPSRQAASQASLELPKELGVGEDGSLGSAGIEIQTPIVHGKLGENLINNACDVLNKHKFKVSENCGFHVHIDVGVLDKLDPANQLNSIKKLWVLYMALEDVLVSFLPPSRRNNDYCHALKTEYSIDEVIRARNFGELEKLWYRESETSAVTLAKSMHRHTSRYRGINLHPLFQARHLEIRYHSGTLNARKICEWVNLNTALVNYALNTSLDWKRLKADSNSELSAKTEILFRIANLTPQAQGYFLARQMKFKAKSPRVRGQAFEAGMELLKNEPEK